MEILVLLSILFVAILILTIKRMFLKEYKKEKEVKNPNFDLKMNMKFLLYVYFSLSFFLLIIFLFSFLRFSDLLFHKTSVPGSLILIECSQNIPQENKNCLDLNKVFVVEYSFKNKIYNVVSAGNGVLIHNPSPLANKKLKIGDSVEVIVNSMNPNNSIVSEDFGIVLFNTILFGFIPIMLAIHSFILLFKQKKGGS